MLLLAGGPAAGARGEPVRVRVALACCQTNAAIGAPVRIRWQATSLAPGERSVVYWPRRALDAVDYLALRAPSNTIVKTTWQLKDDAWVQRQKKIIATSRDSEQVEQARILLKWNQADEYGRWGPRTTGGIPTRMLRPGQTVSGVWDLAELYAFTQPGEYELVLRAKNPGAIDFTGTTNVQFRIAD